MTTAPSGRSIGAYSHVPSDALHEVAQFAAHSSAARDKCFTRLLMGYRSCRTCRVADSRHAAAFFRATVAGRRTAATVLVLVLVPLAFAAADLAHFGAAAADFIGKVRSAAHERGRRPAEFGTILVEPDAIDQGSEVAFAQTSLPTMLAFLRAFDAGVDTGAMLFVWHGTPPEKIEHNSCNSYCLQFVCRTSANDALSCSGMAAWHSSCRVFPWWFEGGGRSTS